MKKRECPICNGSGKIIQPFTDKQGKTKQRVFLTKELRNKGYSIRQIAKLLNVKSPNTIMYYLNK